MADRHHLQQEHQEQRRMCLLEAEVLIDLLPGAVSCTKAPGQANHSTMHINMKTSSSSTAYLRLTAIESSVSLAESRSLSAWPWQDSHLGDHKNIRLLELLKKLIKRCLSKLQTMVPLQVIFQQHFHLLLFIWKTNQQNLAIKVHMIALGGPSIVGIEIIRTDSACRKLPSANCLSTEAMHSTEPSSFRMVQRRPIIVIRRISCGLSKSSNNICRNAPALEPSSTCNSHGKLHCAFLV